MAGTILIGEKKGLPLSTIEFDYLVERIRLAFNNVDEDFMREIYEPLDEGGMTFISLIGLNEKGFQAFAHATAQAYSQDSQEGAISKYKSRWNELLAVLADDPRYVPFSADDA